MVNTTPTKNYVNKRDGRTESVHLDKITSRIQKLCYGLNMDYVDPLSITLQVISGLYPGVTTIELDTKAAEIAVTKSTLHPDYATLAARIAISNLQKQTKKHFSDVIDDLYNATCKNSEKRHPIISDKHHAIVMKNSNVLNSSIIYDRDFLFDYFGFKTLQRHCLLKLNGKIVERPQHMLMRVSIGIHGDDIEAAIKTYNQLSEKAFMLPLATLLGAATVKPQLAPSFVVSMPDDSLEGIFSCLTHAATVLKSSGSVGINLQNIRAKGTEIVGTNGVSNGLVPMLRVFNNMTLFIDNGLNAPTEACIYLEPWHLDIFDVLKLKKSFGKDEYRASDLSYGLWVPDLFMQRVRDDAEWSLMCPHQAPGLYESWGADFEKLYEKYENEKRYSKRVSARDLFKTICESQLETGGPRILYKDACNKKSNQQHSGVLRGSSAKADLLQFTSSAETGSCQSGSIAVHLCVNPNRDEFNFEKLKDTTKFLVKILNKMIDVTDYPVPEAKEASLQHRPIGIGVQGLADAFLLLRLPFESEAASKLNLQIFETIYYGALEASCELAEKDGVYPSYKGSPVSQGLFQFDMWGVTPTDLWDWSVLKEIIAKHGLRNSQLISVSVSQSMAQILGTSQAIEAYSTNVVSRNVSSGEYQEINPYLIKDLMDRDLWSEDMKDKVLKSYGSVQGLSEIPEDLRKLYKTVWEISQKTVINMAADRGAFIDQSQSMSICIPDASHINLLGIMSSVHLYGWEKGLKTGLYYLKKTSARNTNA